MEAEPMIRLLIAAVLVLTGTLALSDTTNILLDPDRLRNLSEAEYLAAVRAAKNVNAQDKSGITPLHRAAKVATPEVVAALIEAGADVDLPGSVRPTVVFAIRMKLSFSV